MISGLEEKYNIYLIAFLFFFILSVSFYISYTKKTPEYMTNDELTYEEFVEKYGDELTEQNVSDDCTDFCGDGNLIEMINKRIEESGLSEYLNQDFSSVPSIDKLPQIERDENLNCTNIFNFTEIIKYDRSYRYSFSDSNAFYVSEKYVKKINKFYVLETVSKINIVGSETYSTIMNSYYLEDGTCVQSEYSNDYSDGFNSLGCSGNYNVFMCRELVEKLNYDGEEKYHVYGKSYDVYVYSNDENSFIIKYGKNIPVLFYLYEETNDNNKYLLIELLSVERGKI